MNVKFLRYLNLYADDTSITMATDNTDEITNDLSMDISVSHNWTVINLLKLTRKKNCLTLKRKMLTF